MCNTMPSDNIKVLLDVTNPCPSLWKQGISLPGKVFNRLWLDFSREQFPLQQTPKIYKLSKVISYPCAEISNGFFIHEIKRRYIQAADTSTSLKMVLVENSLTCSHRAGQLRLQIGTEMTSWLLSITSVVLLSCIFSCPLQLPLHSESNNITF